MMSFPTEPKAVRRYVGRAGLFFCIFTLWFTYLAVSCEVKGTARYPLGRGGRTVTRESSPSEFRQGTNLMWGATVLSGVIAVGSIMFYRKLDDHI